MLSNTSQIVSVSRIPPPPFHGRHRLWRFHRLIPGLAILGTMAMLVPCASGNPPPEVVAEHGSVDASGKFVPPASGADAGGMSRDPAKWREELADLVEDLENGSLRIGLVRIDAEKRIVSFPAYINARSGLIEYALVTEKGKVHESLLATKASPWHVHLGALLTGLAAADDDAPPIEIDVLIEWETNGPRRSHRLEELIALAKDSACGPRGGTLEIGCWNYHGSIVNAHGFAASREGSLITLIGDPSALILNPRPGHIDDSLHVPNAALLPSNDFPVTVILRAAPPAEPAKNNPTPSTP